MEQQIRPHHLAPRASDGRPGGAHRAGGARRAPDLGAPTEAQPGSDHGAILLLAPQPFYEDRGTPIAVRQVLEALSQLGHRVDVVTYPVGGRLELPGVRYFRAANPLRFRRVPIGLSLRKLMLDLCLIPSAWKRLRAERYMAIHAVEEAAFPAVELGRRYGIPVVYDMQSSLPEQLAIHAVFRSRPVQRLLRAAEAWLLRRVDFVVASAGLAERVAALAPATPLREWHFASKVPRASPEEVAALREALAIPRGAPVVLYSGTFASYQGLPDLIAAIPLVVEAVPDAIFVLVGAEGAEGAGVARLAESRVQARHLRVVERQHRDRIQTFLVMADVLVSPRSCGDNLPLKIFDYMAAGRPIVATDVPAHRALLDTRCAELVAASELGSAIARLLRDPARAARLGAAVQAYAKSRLGWMRFVGAVGELYQEVHARAGQLTSHG